MTRTRVKICGLTTAADRDAAIAAGADAVGFITEVPVETARELEVSTVATLARDVPPFVTSVLVTMPETVDAAVELQGRVDADAVQIHGGLAPADIEELGERVDASLVVAVDNQQPDVLAYAAAADVLLVDSTTDSGAGGTGQTHDWEATREIAENTDTPLMLAGGLTPANVREAIETVSPFAVDTASGVEETEGEKDREAVRNFIERATGVEP